MQEVQLMPLWVTVFITIWAAVGPLAGILIGHRLTRSWQRTQRIADNQKEEYRKLLEALNGLNMALCDQHSEGRLDLEALKPLMAEITNVINTSLFIADFLGDSKVASDVLDAVKKLIQNNDLEGYRVQYWEAVNMIVAAAKKITH